MESHFYSDAPGVLQMKSKRHKSCRRSRCEESLHFFVLFSNEQIPDNLVFSNWIPGQNSPVIDETDSSPMKGDSPKVRVAPLRFLE